MNDQVHQEQPRKERVMEGATAALFVALALLANSPAFAQTRYQYHSSSAASAKVGSAYGLPANSDDVPFAPF